MSPLSSPEMLLFSPDVRQLTHVRRRTFNEANKELCRLCHLSLVSFSSFTSEKKVRRKKFGFRLRSLLHSWIAKKKCVRGGATRPRSLRVCAHHLRASWFKLSNRDNGRSEVHSICSAHSLLIWKELQHPDFPHPHRYVIITCPQFTWHQAACYDVPCTATEASHVTTLSTSWYCRSGCSWVCARVKRDVSNML